MAPAGTPAPIIAKLNAAFARVLRTPETIEALGKQDFQVVAGTPEAFGEHLRSEQAKWAEVVKRSGAEIS
jgi:tripartite-type tricarboxylate transporter receptor subunit TctC